jgi:hypothetical protein
VNYRKKLEAELERVRASAVAVRAMGLDASAFACRASELWSELEKCKRAPAD